MYTNNRDAYRQTFFEAWQKYQKNLPLEPLETQLIQVILLHPEYQALLESVSAYQHQEFTIEENPFLHMSLHMTIREQIRLNRPAGITAIHQQLIENSDAHQAEHRMMECLAQMIWQAQQNGVMASDEEYLQALNKISLP